LSYTFSAKERDSETGLSYFGSRYYSSDLSIWLSVDPMSDKYASLSPYVYCADNPVKLVDPNGAEVYDGGDPSLKRLERFFDFFDKKIRTPLMNMVENGASDDELESAAAFLANKYQKKLLRGFRTVTGWDRKEGVDIKVFSETEETVNVESRPDNQEMMVCGEIPVGPDVYSAEVNFAPYGIENNATFTALNKVETGWINSPDGNSFSYDLEVDGASSISYCIQNRLKDKRQDNWNFSVTLRSRRLDIRPVGRISSCRTRKKTIRSR
jgi:RHS repeat-associated protein